MLCISSCITELLYYMDYFDMLVKKLVYHKLNIIIIHQIKVVTIVHLLQLQVLYQLKA